MKPAQERNQECLPPKKRDLPVTSSGAAAGTGVAVGGGGGSAVGEDEVVSIQNTAANSNAQGGAKSGDWLRAQPALHYGVESSDGIPAVSVDQYSMLYKVALPSVTYSSSLHPVLSHISPAYTVHSPLLQHPGLPYPPPLGYAQIPHSSLQFVTSPYAVPYTLPPGFVPGSLMSPSGTISQPHAVSHIVPYPSVMQEDVSPPPQPQVAAHAFAKVAASGGVPLMLSSEQAPQHHLTSSLPAAELGSRGVPVFYHSQIARPTTASSAHQGNEREINGGDKGHRSREVLTDVAHSVRNAHLPHLTSTLEHSQDKHLQAQRLEERSSQSQRSTPDSDLEVQQVVGRLASSSAGRKEVSFAPLNLSQSTQRARDARGESTGGISGLNVYPVQPVSCDSRVNNIQQQQPVPPGHAVVIANGQPVLIPLEYHAQHQSHPPPQHYAGQVNDEMQNRNFKASDSSARLCLPDRFSGESNTAHQPPAQPPAEVTQAIAPTTPSNPSHFMKGAIIQLATGELKRVEDLQTQDFVRSAELSGGLKIDSSMVVNILASQQRPGLVSLHFTVGEQQSKVTIDVPPEHPFFVFGQGWSSCSPERTAQLYGLSCHHLQVGDVCVSITLQQQQQLQAQQQKQPQQQHHHHHHHQQQQQQQQQALTNTLSKSNSTSGPAHQLMGPPAAQQSRSPSHFRIDRIHRERQRDKEVLDRDNAAQLVGVGHIDPPVRSSRASAEHPRSHSSYHLHTEGSTFSGGAMQPVSSLRRWSSPGLQRYSVKGDEGPQPPMSTTRPSFIPQEVKLSIEGRSNAGK